MDEDAVLMAIGGFRSDIQNMGREIGQLRDSIEKRDTGCTACRREIDGEIQEVKNSITPLKNQRIGDEAVVSFLDTLAGRIVTCIGIISGSAALIAVYVWPVVLQIITRGH